MLTRWVIWWCVRTLREGQTTRFCFSKETKFIKKRPTRTTTTHPSSNSRWTATITNKRKRSSSPSPMTTLCTLNRTRLTHTMGAPLRSSPPACTHEVKTWALPYLKRLKVSIVNQKYLAWSLRGLKLPLYLEMWFQLAIKCSYFRSSDFIVYLLSYSLRCRVDLIYNL